MRKCEHKILVEEEIDECLSPNVVVVPMDKNEFPEVLEIRDCVISCLDCLHTFFSIESNTHTGFLNMKEKLYREHVDIVCSITDSQHDFSRLLYHPHKLSLEFWDGSCAHNGIHFQKHLLQHKCGLFCLLVDVVQLGTVPAEHRI